MEGVFLVNKILIVDDAAFMRLCLKQMLENNGFEVVGEAENGLNGIRKYKELQPDLITMDITMPEMDGIEALTVIKQLNPTAKVIMVSALGQESIVRQAIMCGAKTFIVKPFKQEHVIRTIKQVLAY
jgi:two-component system, chemotaxis family, chemotaxis protein CheY